MKALSIAAAVSALSAPLASQPDIIFENTGSPVFIPKKHTKQTYGQQRRSAKKRKLANRNKK